MSSEIIKKQDAETIQIAEDVLRELPERNLKEKTKQLYILTARIYYDALHKVEQTQSKRTYYVRRAALTYFAKEELRNAVLTKAAKKAAQAMLVLANFFSAPAALNPQAGTGACPLASPVKRISKRRSLRGLPADWREQIIAGTVNPEMSTALLLLAATGVRPSEIEIGVSVTPVIGGVRVTVRGTKTDRGHGQPLRVFEVISTLAEKLGALGAQTIKIDSANRISSLAGRLGRKLFGQMRACTVSAYSFRHMFASELKASQINGLDVSAILGHSVSDTKKSYGCAKQGRTGIRAKLLHASREVKIIGQHARPAKRLSSGHEHSSANAGSI
jgi:integrase